MPQGIRRTNLMQARTEDPFEALLRTDAQRMARNQQSEQSLLAREAKRGMFDEEMEMKGSQFDRKFAETQMQNAASRANAAARLGLARSAAGNALTPEQKLKMWKGKENFLQQGRMDLQGLRNKGAKNGKGFSALGGDMYNLLTNEEKFAAQKDAQTLRNAGKSNSDINQNFWDKTYEANPFQVLHNDVAYDF